DKLGYNIREYSGNFSTPYWNGNEWIESYVEPTLTDQEKITLYTDSENRAFQIITDKCMNDAGKLDLFAKRLEILNKATISSEEEKFIEMVASVERYISNVMSLYNQYKRSVKDALKKSDIIQEPDYSGVEVPAKYKHCRFMIDSDYASLF